MSGAPAGTAGAAPLARRAGALAAAAVLATALVAALLAWWWSAPAPLPPPRGPFGMGGLEGAARAPGGPVAAWLLAQQAGYYRALAGAVRAAAADPGALASLLGLALAYGAFHAAGPGHGKAVVAAYVVADERALRRSIAVAALAAALQGLVAVALVLGAAGLLGLGARAMTDAALVIERASYAAIAALGAWLLWRKGRALAALLTPAPTAPLAAAPGCDHFHLPGPDAVAAPGRFGWRSALAVVGVAGLRPCTGALLVLVFALSQGVAWIGVAAVAAMSLGTALTTGAVAALAVLAKGLALRLASGRGRGALVAARALEALAALGVLLLGLGLLAGALAATGGA